MALMGQIGRSRAGRFALGAALFIIVVLAVRFVAYEIEAVMWADPMLQPPAWQIQRQATQMSETVVADDYLGFRLAANRSEHIETLDFSFRRATGVDGFPVFDGWPEQADAVFLGDSMILGEGVGTQRSFVARIQAAWSDRVVINLGVPGAGPERQRRVYERYGAPLAPALVVVCLYLASDLENDTHFFAWLADSRGMAFNEFRLGYRQRMDTRPKEHLGRRLELHPLFSWGQSYIEPLLWGELRIPHRVGFADGSKLFLERQKIKFARRTYQGDEPELARAIESVERLRQQVEAKGARLVVLLLPSKEEVYGVAADADLVNAPRRFKRTLATKGVAVLDLEPALRTGGAERPAFFRRDIHLNDLGNALVADRFLEWSKVLD